MQFKIKLKLSDYLTSLLSVRNRNYSTQSSKYLTSDFSHVHVNVGRTKFSYDALLKWKGCVAALKHESFVPSGDFTVLQCGVFIVVKRFSF